MISNDVRTKGVNDFNQSTLDYYSNLIPLRTQASTEMASAILKTLKSSNFNHERPYICFSGKIVQKSTHKFIEKV